jgi:excisionase family DNA binding protein
VVLRIARLSEIVSMERENRIEGQTPVLTVGEVAKYLHVHPTTIYRLLKMRKLPGFRVGSDWRFNLETIEAWMQQQMPTVK